MEERYKHLNTYLKEKFGERTLKICIDGHFTCPNRDGKISTGGCIFCSERGSGDLIADTASDISSQVHNYFKSYKAERANKFIVYFQNFTNTYDSLENLKLKYDAALIDNRIVGLDVATRPDCINEDIVKLLYSYTNKYSVTVELGLQTSSDVIGNLINRGYSSSQFINAVNLLNKYHIDVVAHMMVGLPQENLKDFPNIRENTRGFSNISADVINTVDFLNNCNIHGLKIHSTYVIKNTELNNMYQSGTYIPLSLNEYLNSLVYIITHIRPDIIIHRITGDAPKNLLVAPEWNTHKKLIMNGLDKILKDNNLYQGMYFTNKSH